MGGERQLRRNINIDKKIFLYGWKTGSGDPIIDAGSGGGSAITLSPGSYGTEIQGFRLRNSNEAGINVLSNNNYISFISADHNEYGVLVESSSGANDIGASIEASTFSQNDYGIRLDSSTDYIIQLNTVTDNDHGIYLYSSSNNYLQGNDMKNIGEHDSFDDTKAAGLNYWDGNRFSNHNSPHKIPGGVSIDENPASKKPSIPDVADMRHIPDVADTNLMNIPIHDVAGTRHRCPKNK